MDPNFQEIDTDHPLGHMAQAFAVCNAQRERDRRWQKLSLMWRHEIGGVSTIAWLVLSLAAVAALNLGLERPWF